MYGPIAHDLVVGLLVDRPDLDAYPEAVAAWAESEAQCLLLRRHASEVGLLDGDGNPRAFTRLLKDSENAASRHRTRLGLDPVAEASLQRERAETAHLAVDIEAILARGRAATATTAEVEADPVAGLLETVKAEGAERWERANEHHNR
ncbi:MAG: hypothetical protein Q4G64_08820, partial [bacterium]|nr:hypothetical protein [bacterium]